MRRKNVSPSCAEAVGVPPPPLPADDSFFLFLFFFCFIFFFFNFKNLFEASYSAFGLTKNNLVLNLVGFNQLLE